MPDSGPGVLPFLKYRRPPQGENPFTDSPEEEKEQEEAEGGALDEGALVEAAGVAEDAPAQPPVPPEPVSGAATPPPPPPPEEEEEALPLLGGALQRQIRGIPGLDVEADDEEEGGGGAPLPGRAGPAWQRLEAESNKVLPFPPLLILSVVRS